MANEYRKTLDFTYGTLTNSASSTDTVLTSADFANLGTDYGATIYTPIVLLNASTKQEEMVWVTAHVSGATSVTVVRARENTSAKSWPAGTSWVVAPSTRDGLYFTNTSGAPADAHVGMRGIFLDLGEEREKTFYQGWQGSVKANGADMGRTLDGTTSIPAGNMPILKSWTVSGTTTASGNLDATIPNGGFPTKLVSAVMTRANVVGSWFVPGIDPGATTKTVIRINAGAPSGSLISTAIAVSILAVGY